MLYTFMIFFCRYKTQRHFMVTAAFPDVLAGARSTRFLARWLCGLMFLLSQLSSPARPALVRARPPQLSGGVAWVESLGGDVKGADAGAAYYDLFTKLAESREFAHETWARKPMLLKDTSGVAASFTLEQLEEAVENDFLDAGRGVPDIDAPGGWKMAPVSQPRGSSFEDAKMRYVDVVEALKQGTVVFNSAGASISPLGTMCLAAMDAFQLPNCLNLYVTAKGTTTSAPPHTDKQDVFVLQSCGAKRWRVFEPPPPAAKPNGASPNLPTSSRLCALPIWSLVCAARAARKDDDARVLCSHAIVSSSHWHGTDCS